MLLMRVAFQKGLYDVADARRVITYQIPLPISYKTGSIPSIWVFHLQV